MRWRALFDDLEVQFAASERLAEESEIADRVRLEQSGILLIDRLRGQLGLILRIRVSGGELFDGELTHVGSEWVVLSKATGDVVIPLVAVQLVEGLGRKVLGDTSRVRSALGLASALRTLARDRSHVVVHRSDAGARIEGTIDRVGKDFMEIAAVLPGEQRRSGSVGAVYGVPFTGIAAVSSRS
ncbi:hypothetical protein [Arthrobacter tecti]